MAGIVGGGLPWLYHGTYWRTAYVVGGCMGLALLLLRIGVTESGMFRHTQTSGRFSTRPASSALCATVATTTPNFVRATAALLAMRLRVSRTLGGAVAAAAVLGVVAIGIGFAGLVHVRETFGIDLDYVEE